MFLACVYDNLWRKEKGKIHATCESHGDEHKDHVLAAACASFTQFDLQYTYEGPSMYEGVSRSFRTESITKYTLTTTTTTTTTNTR
jgi:hypothetical protein